MCMVIGLEWNETNTETTAQSVRLWYTRYWCLLGCGANFWPGLIYPIYPMQGKDSPLPVLTSTEGCNSPRIVIRFIQFHRNTPLNAYLLCAICNQFPCTTHDIDGPCNYFGFCFDNLSQTLRRCMQSVVAPTDMASLPPTLCLPPSLSHCLSLPCPCCRCLLHNMKSCGHLFVSSAEDTGYDRKERVLGG